MCGFAGISRFDSSAADLDLVRAMTETLHHRGPDATDAWASKGIALGHKRLSIIDLDGSSQPMTSHDGRYTLAFNGEILNFRELRQTLAYPFRTRGDTEVLLAGLSLHGPTFLTSVRGQFAFALADTHEGTVLLGRDPAGIIPLVYHHDSRRIAFASEIKALLPAIPDIAVDVESLDRYLARNAVPAPHTLFRGVKKVRPGHTVTVGRDGSLVSEAYWALPSGSGRSRISAAEAMDGVHARLRSAVQAALVADVPVGAYLSGGVDSSLITAIIRSLDPGRTIETFSAGFGDPRFDELPFAQAVSTHLGTVHHEVSVKPEDFAELWPRLTWHRDAPLSQPGDVAVFRLAELARTRVKVVLSGEGSDELFAGYNKYRLVRLAEAGRLVPQAVRGSAARSMGRRLPHGAGIGLRALTAPDASTRRESWFAPFQPHERARLLGRAPSRMEAEEVSGDAIRRQLESDFNTWLPDNLLERGDRMSMAASLELRPPFLDRELIDYAFSLPSSMKIRRGQTKWLVKEIGRLYLPETITDRPKVGFKVPLDAWFRGGLRDMARDLLAADSFTSQLLDRREVAALLDRHESGAANEEARIWTLLGLEVWHRQFLRGTHPAPTSARR